MLRIMFAAVVLHENTCRVHTSITGSQVHEFGVSAVVFVVLRRTMPAFPDAADEVADRSGQGAGVHAAADHVPGAGVGAAGARPTLRSRGGGTRRVRAPAHDVPAFRVLRTFSPILFRLVRDAHEPGQVLGAGKQGRQRAGSVLVPGTHLDRHVPGRLPVRLAHRISKHNFSTTMNTSSFYNLALPIFHNFEPAYLIPYTCAYFSDSGRQ